MEKAFTLSLDGTQYAVIIRGNTVIVDGHSFVASCDDHGKVVVDGMAYDMTLDGDEAIIDGVAHKIRLSGFDTEVAASSSTARPAPSPSGAGVVKAIMPGSIVRVMVSDGDTVAAGDVLLVLEAMKMENEMRAPFSGTVSTVYVTAGQAVEANAVLAEMEPLD